MERVIRSFYENESGASSMEYAILVGCIAVTIISTVGVLGQVVEALYTKANTKMP